MGYSIPFGTQLFCGKQSFGTLLAKMQSLSKKTIMTVGILADHEISQKMDVLFVLLQTLVRHCRLLTLIAALATPDILATSDITLANMKAGLLTVAQHFPCLWACRWLTMKSKVVTKPDNTQGAKLEPLSIGKMWNACVFEIERPAGEERNRIRGTQRRGFFALRPQGAFHLEGARIPRLTCLENGKPLA